MVESRHNHIAGAILGAVIDDAILVAGPIEVAGRCRREGGFHGAAGVWDGGGSVSPHEDGRDITARDAGTGPGDVDTIFCIDRNGRGGEDPARM